MGTSLRGELTRSSSVAAPSQPTLDHNLENIQGVLSQFIRLSQLTGQGPKIVVSHDSDVIEDTTAQDAAAPWSWTAAEAASTEAVLLPFLIHLAAAKNDVQSIKFCLSTSESSAASETIASSPEGQLQTPRYGNTGGGLVNCLEPGSGRSPLHVAALNGSTECLSILLHAGALVHLRDCLGHTSLYYVGPVE
jgi:lysophospholipase